MSQPRRDLPANFFGQEWGGVEAPHELMFAPARTILPLIRYPLGYAMVNPLRMLPVTLFMVVVPPFTWGIYAALLAGTGRHVPADTGHIYLVAFALLSFAVSTAVFMRRWIGARRGERIHQRETGYSWLAHSTTLPIALTEVLIVPLAVGTIGWIIDDTVSINLGRWLILSGCSLFGLAFWEGRRRWSQQRSAIDEQRRAEVYERGFDVRAGKQATTQEPDEAELGHGLAQSRTRARETLTSNEQPRNVGSADRRGHSLAQDTDETLF